MSATRAFLKVCHLSYGPDFDKAVTITKGKWEKIGGVNSYVAVPSGDYPRDKAILFLTDVFGPQLVNNQVRSSIDVAGRSCYLTQIDHRFSSSLTILLLTALKLVALVTIRHSYCRGLQWGISLTII